MAIAFARIDVHTRSKGHSAIHAAAYRAASKLYDERTGITYDYTNRHDMRYHDVMLPDGANEKFLDQETLWNEAERMERRKDSQVAKDVKLALPRGVSEERLIELTRNFAFEHFVSHGLAADIAIHDKHDGNPHAHIYITMRRLKGNSFDRLKARDLNPTFANSSGKKGFIKENDYWGEQWRYYQNAYFYKHGIDEIVDPNNLITGRHEGRIRNNESHYIKEENRLKKKVGREIAIHETASLLNLLGTTYAVFTERDMQKLVFQCLNQDDSDDGGENGGEGGNQCQLFQTVFAKLMASRDLINLGPGEDGRERYTTRANYCRETRLIDQAKELHKQRVHAVRGRYLKRAQAVYSLNNEQLNALKAITCDRGISTLVGRAGTGKSSYVLKAALGAWKQSGYNVHGMAVSGIATKGLQEASGIQSSIICAVKHKILKNKWHLTKKDIVVMDEAGMTDLNDMPLIVEAVQKTGAKLVLVGDTDQLQPVGPGAPFRAICDHIGFTELKDIQRQVDLGDRQASVFLSQGKINKALGHYLNKGCVYITNTEEMAIAHLMVAWEVGLEKNTLSQQIILAHRNKDVDALNQFARQLMVNRGVVSEDGHDVKTTRGLTKLASGDRVLFLRNNKKMGIHNGDLATIINIQRNNITVELDNQTTKQFSLLEYNDLTYGYAVTVHKTQGGTFDDVYVYAGGRAWNRHLTYVALTRHRNLVNLFADRETHYNGLVNNLGRDDLRDSVLDWPISYAIRRGFDPEGMIGRFVDSVAGVNQSIKDKWLFVSNYEAYLLMQSRKGQCQIAETRKRDAKKVATFIDLHRALGKQWSGMKRTLADGQDITEHADYMSAYKQRLHKNKLAFEIAQQQSNFELALSKNSISIGSLESMAEAHKDAERAKHYVKAYQQCNYAHREQLSKKINIDLKAHYSALAYFAKKHNIEPKALIKQLRLDAQEKEKQRPPPISIIIKDESLDWDALKSINNSDAEWLQKYRDIALKKTDKKKVENLYKYMGEFMDKLAHDKDAMKQIKKKAPRLYIVIAQTKKQKEKEISINWQAPKLREEWENLRAIKNGRVQWMVKLYDLAQGKDDKKELASINRSIDDLAIKVSHDKHTFKAVKQVAPKLANQIHQKAKTRGKDKGMDREY